MCDRFRPLLSYANVMATIAVFGVLAGGGAYAASKIGPNQIQKNAVRAKHIKGNQVAAKHVRSRAIKPRHLATPAVTFRSQTCAIGSASRVVALGSLVVECFDDALGNVQARARTTVNNASIQSPTNADFDFDVGETFGLSPAPSSSPIVYSRPNGSVISLSLGTLAGGGPGSRRVVGTAIGG